MDPDSPAPRRRRRRSARVTERDRELLEFAARHRLLFSGHAQALLDASAEITYGRLRALTRARLLAKQPPGLHGGPAAYRITAAGLRLVDSLLPTPRFDDGTLVHDAGVAWLWLAARRGAVGPLDQVISERELRSFDGRRAANEQPLGVKLGGWGPRGQQRIHYPDLVLVDPSGRRVAVELELSAKSRSRRERIFAGYATDPRTDIVLYLVESDAIGRAVQQTARAYGIERRVKVQRVECSGVPQAAVGDRAAIRRHRAAASREHHGRAPTTRGTEAGR